MKQFLLPIGLVAGALAAAEIDPPSFKRSIGFGAGLGGQVYNGSYGEGTTLLARGFVRYSPIEWLGTRLTFGMGNLSDGEVGLYATDGLSNLGLDLVLQPRLGTGDFRPYLASGISTSFGASTLYDRRTDRINENYDLDWNFYLPVELGAEVLLNERWSIWSFAETYLHAEEWDRWDGDRSGGAYFDARDDIYKFGFGATMRFGLKQDEDGDQVVDGLDRCPATRKGVPVDEEGCPLDADRDRVPDFRDRCPATPKASDVDSVGCPLDTDRDGVPDYLDVCASTPAGIAVDGRGCPPDLDRDGVPDFKDRCAGSVAGRRVDAGGCEIPDSDGDGVQDDRDRCVGTEPGSKVDPVGCPLVRPDSTTSK